MDRDDAALVYRFLRDHGPADAVQITEACFPLTFGRDDPLYGRLIKRGLSRSFASIQWLRSQGVGIVCVTDNVSLSRFSLVT